MEYMQIFQECSKTNYTDELGDNSTPLLVVGGDT